MLALRSRTIYRLLSCLRFWFVDPGWSRAEFVLTSSLLMSDSKTQAVIYYSGSFRLFSEALHYSTVPLLNCMAPRIMQQAEGLWFSAVYFFSPHCWLKVTFMGHPDKAILPAAQTRPVFSTDFLIHLYSLFFFWETQAAFCDPQPRSRLRQKEVSLTWAPWQPLGSLVRVLSPHS